MSVEKVSVVVPAFNEAENLPLLLDRLTRALSPYDDHEIVIVDDGSKDDTVKILRAYATKDARLRYISLSRNFGHQSALKAGLDSATGNCVICLDADLQHPPEHIGAMMQRWREGFEVVNMVRQDDPSTPLLKRVTAKLFYRFLNAISDFEIRPGTADFRLLDRRVVNALASLEERTLFLRGALPWLGFRQCYIDYVPESRAHGQTKYDLHRMLILALDGITSSSIRPLRLSTYLGLIMAGLGTIYASYALILKLFSGYAISGWASLLVAIMTFGGVQLLMLGIIGEYLGKVLVEVKHRPSYIVRERSEALAKIPAASVAEMQERVSRSRVVP
jgi:dolichol-phosphate mannosyltransferase